MAIVVFDPTEFKLKYPPFKDVDDGFLRTCFDTATLYLSNDDCSVVQNIQKRKHLLYLLTAHIAQLMGALNPGGAPSGGVGRISNATEGSVTVGFDFGPVSSSQAWYVQTQYGAMYWAATVYLRSFRYIARPTRY